MSSAPAPDASGSPAVPASRSPVDVAVGILLRPDGSFLLGSRPAGKPYAGYWEFPGGKVEPGETLDAALAREFAEELGVTVHASHFVHTVRKDYPHALVDLHVCHITAWSGQPQPREGQQLAWSRFPVEVAPLLPGAWPLLRELARQLGYSGALSAVESEPKPEPQGGAGRATV